MKRMLGLLTLVLLAATAGCDKKGACIVDDSYCYENKSRDECLNWNIAGTKEYQEKSCAAAGFEHKCEERESYYKSRSTCEDRCSQTCTD